MAVRLNPRVPLPNSPMAIQDSPSVDTPDVELRGVTKTYGDILAVDDVSFQVKKGEFFSLLGPSGCGKTSTLRLIAGFEEVDSGDVVLRGKVVNEVAPYRRRVGMVFQNLALFPHMNVFQNLAFGLKMKRISSKHVSEGVKKILEVVDLPGVEERRIDQLSGGQQQRVALARALITEPTVLLLDEPLGALDLKLRVQMQNELKQVHAHVGTTFIYVTHDQGEALAMSDRIGVMTGGRIQQIDSPIEIYERPANSFVADFIGETNLLRGKLLDSHSAKVKDVTFSVAETKERVGGSVFLSLRPEKLRVSRESLAGPNNFQGKVKDLTFRGARVEVRLEIGKMKLRAEADSRVVSGIKVGSTISAAWEPEDMLVLPT